MERDRLNDNLPLRIAAWIINIIGRQTLLALGLLLMGLGSLIFALVSLVRGLEATLLWPVAGVAVCVGWILERSRLRWILAGPLAATLGLLAIPLRIGRLEPALLAALVSLNHWILDLGRAYPGASLPGIAPVVQTFVPLSRQMLTILGRSSGWLVASFKGAQPYDPVAIAVVWSCLLWMVSAWSAWCVRRELPLIGMLPVGLVLGGLLAFTHSSLSLLLLYLAATLILMARSSYRLRRQSWESHQIDYSEEIQFDLVAAVILFSMSVTLLAAYAPSFSPQKISAWVRSLNTARLQAAPVVQSPGRAASPARSTPINPVENLGKSLGLSPPLTPTPPSPLTGMLAGGLPQEHLLGSGPELSRQIVMVIQVEPLAPATLNAAQQPNRRYYWQAFSYDRYTGHGWSSSATQIKQYGAGEPVYPPGAPVQFIHFDPQWQLRQNVQIVASEERLNNLIYVAGDLQQVEQPYRIAWRSQPGARTPGDLFGVTAEAQDYQLVTWLPAPSQADLQSAGEAYPAEILDRYMDLPASLPGRVSALARALTATAATPFDRATAIETYVRTFPYTLDLPSPPTDRDIVDYFLFDLKRGYCDYDASAMVVLARAAGLPARLAMGYATGSYDPSKQRYVISEADAHSWPEIYFPGYGWIAFEPTGGLAPLNLPAEQAVLEVPQVDQPQAAAAAAEWARYRAILVGLLTLAAAGLTSVLVWGLSESWRLQLLDPPATLLAVYRRLYRRGPGLGVQPAPGSTPQEYGETLAGQIESLTTRRPGQFWVTPGGDEARQLTEFYARSIYSSQPANPRQQKAAISIWKRLRLRLYMAHLLSLLANIGHRG